MVFCFPPPLSYWQRVFYIQSVLGKQKAELFLADGMTADKFKRLGLDRSFMPMGLDELLGVDYDIPTINIQSFTAKDSEVQRLAFDFASGRGNIAEATLMAILQEYYQSKARRFTKDEVMSSKPLGDFIFIDGDMRGQSVDFMFTTKDNQQFNIDKMNEHFLNKNGELSNANKKSIAEHLLKDVALIPLDLTNLTAENKIALLLYISSLSQDERQRFVLIENDK